MCMFYHVSFYLKKKQWHNAYDNTPSGVPLNDDLSMPVNNSRVKRQFYDEYYDNIKIWR